MSRNDSWWQRMGAAVLRPVDAASLGVVRIAFGLAMLWQMIILLQDDLAAHYIEPRFFFKYHGFEWVDPPGGAGMYVLVGVTIFAAAMVTLGLAYRLFQAVIAFCWTWIFLIDQTHYQNHHFLMVLLSFLLLLMPANRAYSIDALFHARRQRRIAPSAPRSWPTVPVWSVWLVRAQLGIVYFYGGIAKLNWDWLDGGSMRIQLGKRMDFPLIGDYFEHGAMIMFFTYAGLLFDLFVVPGLLWKPSRRLTLCCCAMFHFCNAFLFRIGIFPWFMMAATFVYLEPDWPRRLLRYLASIGGGKTHEKGTSRYFHADPVEPENRTVGGFIALAMIVYLTIQCAWPLRHFTYGGNVAWDRAGERFSWHMRLHHRMLQHPRLYVSGTGSDGEAFEEKIDMWNYVTGKQYQVMTADPDMLLQLSKHVASDYLRRGCRSVSVRAHSAVGLNGRPFQVLIDPEVNLATQMRSYLPYDWVLPMEQTEKTAVVFVR